jgi:Flp pilus assembly protein TadB
MSEGAYLAAMLVIGAASAYESHRAAKATEKSNKKANRLERTTAEIENQRNARRAIAARRLQQAELIQAAQSSNVGANSSVSGAVGSLTTQTASNIGFANTQLAGQVATSNVLLRGQSKALKHNTRAAGLSLFGQGIGMAGSSGLFTKPAGTAAPKINPQLTINGVRQP